jgi:hypothetical protein
LIVARKRFSTLIAYSDDAAHAFQYEAAQVYRFQAAQRSNFKPPTWTRLMQIV